MRVLTWGLVLILGSSLHLSAQAQELVVYFNERPPLYSAGEGGVLTEIAKLVLKEASIPFRLVEVPSQRVLFHLQEGDEYAVGLGWFRTPDREVWARFSTALYQDLPQVLIGRRDKLALLGPAPSLEKSLAKGLVLARKVGYSFGVVIDEKIRTLGARVEETTVEVAQMMTMINGGRMDYTYLGLEEARYLLKKDSSLENLTILAMTNAPKGNYRYFMASPAVPDAVLEKINKAIDRLRSSEAYQKLIDSILRS